MDVSYNVREELWEHQLENDPMLVKVGNILLATAEKLEASLVQGTINSKTKNKERNQFNDQ